MQSEQLDHLREKYRNKNDENKLLDHQLQAFEKYLFLFFNNLSFNRSVFILSHLSHLVINTRCD